MLFRRLNKYIHSVYDADRLNDLNNKRATARAISQPFTWNTS